MDIIIFEDSKVSNFYPLTLLRPLFDLRCGMYSMRDRFVGRYPHSKFYFLSREYIAKSLKQKGWLSFNDTIPMPEVALFVNSRLLLKREDEIPCSGKDESFWSDGELAAFCLTRKTIPRFLETMDKMPFDWKKTALKELTKSTKLDLKIVSYPWEMVQHNAAMLEDDFSPSKAGKILGRWDKAAVLYGPKKNIFVGEGSTVEAGVVIDGRGGPVHVGRNVVIHGPTRLEGPCYIGSYSVIDGARIRSGTSIGRVCRIGGEVEESIFHGYVNKHHDGFIGHSYVGEWVNFGAMTTNSDLKNTYGNVETFAQDSKGVYKPIDTGMMKFGATIGDHSKFGIGSLINTGAVIGICSNIFGGGMAPKLVPSFSWGSGEPLMEYKLDKAVDTARTVMSRRKVEMTRDSEMLMRRAFALTANERKKHKRKK